MKVVGYPRVSTEEQDFKVQVAKIRAYADLHGLDLVEIVTLDEGESGKTLDRPGLSRVLAMLKSGEAEGMIVYKLDRLTRKLKDWCHLIEEYFGEGCPNVLMSVTESVDTRTAGGRLMLNFFIMVAQWERETIVERTKAKLAHMRAAGDRSNATPYGFDLVDDGRRSKRGNLPVKLVPSPTEQAALAFIRSLKDKPHRYIAAELDRAGFKTKQGRPWCHTTVAKLLKRVG